MRERFRVIEENIIDCSYFFRRRAAKIINFAVKTRFASIEELRGDVRIRENERVNVLEFRRNPKRQR
jgi:hypothetical protein